MAVFTDIDPGNGTGNAGVDAAVNVHPDLGGDESGLAGGLLEGLPAHAIANRNLVLGDNQNPAVGQEVEIRRGRAESERLRTEDDKRWHAGLDNSRRR